MHVLAVIEDAVTVLEVGMNHFPPRMDSPLAGVQSPPKHLVWIMELVWGASLCLQGLWGEGDSRLSVLASFLSLTWGSRQEESREALAVERGLAYNQGF